jgi:hypothetical protein
MVKEKLYENYLSFTEDNTDPIKDMKIGIKFLIEKWLNNMGIKDYKLTKKNLINVYNSVMINDKDINDFPEYIRFNHIMGGFHCNNNNLFSLKGCPYTVSGSFMASFNKLYSLKNGPYVVKESYGASHNKLESLEGIAEIIEKSIYINDNNLKNLEYIPGIIKGDLNIAENPLQTLKYFPDEIEGNLMFSLNKFITKEDIVKRCKVWGHIIEV